MTGSNRRPSAHKTDALTNWAKWALREVGFEPTRTYTADLKSAPLDLSGIRAINFLIGTY